MPVSGLVIRLAQSNALAHRAQARLRAHECIELGPCEDGRLAAVVETRSQEEDKSMWRWINDLPGVEFVDVVYVHFDGATEIDERETGDRAPVPMESAR